MRVAVLSDIHGNLHAFEAVLESIARDAPDAVWCLGDLVGYGPRPNRCCMLVAERADVCLIGNHDLAVLGRLDLEVFSPDAAASARWTAGVLEPGARAFLEPLEPSAAREGAGLFHGSPRDPVWEYVLSPEVALASLAATANGLVLVGHSHIALRFGLEERALELCREGTAVDLRSGRWLLNPGSVGQPRDGDPRAAWLLLDLGAGRAVYRRVAYDVARTQAEIVERGLPVALAARLELGI
ncbi:MAG TPA: metallophosphoesterase family protein [Gaiellaceae bacterium]|nr:metallophosphoesterase family protein [Gaiellaceae bacterium]